MGAVGQCLRLMAIGMGADEAGALVGGLLPPPLTEVKTLGFFRDIADFLAVGPDLRVDLILWGNVPGDGDQVVDALHALSRLRPQTGVLLLLDDEQGAQAGPLNLELQSRRQRGEIPPAHAALRRDLGIILRRLLAELGWPVAAVGESTLSPNGHGRHPAGRDLVPEPPAALKVPAPAGPGAQTIVCFGPKGGVGKTTMAVSLAALAAKARPDQVLLVDLDLTSADAAVHLGHGSGPDLVDMLPHLCGEPGPAELPLHRPRGFEFFLAAGPQRPELAELVRPQHIEFLLHWSRRRGMVAIVDTPAGFGDEIVYQALTGADHLVMVTTGDPTSLRQTAMALEIFDRLQVAPSARRWLVLSQASPNGPVSPDRVEAFLGHPISVEIPLDRTACERAVSSGRPLVLSDPGHPISRAVGRLAGHLGWLQGEMDTSGRPGWMARTIGSLMGQRGFALTKRS